MSLEGTLEEGGLVDALRAISAFGYSGLLTVQGTLDLVTVTFVDGGAVAADAMNSPMDEALGHVLAQEGLLSPVQFREALESSRSSGVLASSEVLSRELVERGPLLRAVRSQTYRQLLEALRLREGSYSFALDAESPYESGVEPLSVSEVLVRSVEDLGFEGPMVGETPEIDDVIAPIEDSGIEIKVLGRDGRQIVSQDGVAWLTEDESRLLEAISSPKAASILLMDLDLDQYRVRYGLHALIQAGLASSSELSVSSPLHSGITPSTPLLQTDIDSKLVAQIRELEGGEEISFSADPAPAPVSDLGDVDDPITFDESLLDDPEPAPPSSPSNFSDLTLPPLDEPTVVDSEDSFLPGASTEMPERPRVSQSELADVVAVWLGRALALLFVAVLLSMLVTGAGRSHLLFPFSWDAEARESLESAQLRSVYNRIDQGVRTYHLLYGMYPDELRLLVDLELIEARDRFGPAGQFLSFASDAGDYLVRPESVRSDANLLQHLEGIQHDFLLNPRMTDSSQGASRRPVFLID
ncbi:MAG: DUF4388 domain-containing protein [Acidobacteriota bacterium]